jgi:lipopolysaccharide biosynthesis glycosyltransferase
MRVFIGYDRKQDVAYRTLVTSIRKYNKTVSITPLIKDQLRATGLYWREDKADESTDFTYTRFLVPYLSNYEGISLFIDSDTLVTTDICDILNHYDETKMVMCVQHEDYKVNSITKMDGRVQASYPRKNWSSVMLFNNSLCKILGLYIVNTSSAAYLHRMNWADDKIGRLPKTWNHLVGYYPKKKIKIPKLIHYTDGGPWISDTYKYCDYADLWVEMHDKVLSRWHIIKMNTERWA